MSRILNGIKSFVHSISTSDHYASYDPSRPHGHEDTMPLATTHGGRRSSSSSIGQGYVPGLRSAQMSSSSRVSGDGTASSTGDEGQMRTSKDSIPLTDLAPIPSAELSWQRIDTWIEQSYPELFDQLIEGATSNDLNDLEHDLECALPADVRESYSVHDGQEGGGKPTGVFFGIVLLDLEGISEEWNVWRRAALKIEELSNRSRPQASSAASSSASLRHPPQNKHAWIERQRSCPPDAVQPVYAHPGWIPLAKDGDGNNIAVDLAPGPKGRYGQVILFGRDFDTKFVIAPSWGDFLARFAADLESGHYYIDDDVENAVFAFKARGRLVSYFSVLRTRVERTLPRQAPPPQQRRSISNVTPILQTPVNSGRVTPRLVSPGSSSTSLPLRDAKPRRLAGQFNEIDLSDAAPQKENSDTHMNSPLEGPKSTEHTHIPKEFKEPNEEFEKPKKELEESKEEPEVLNEEFKESKEEFEEEFEDSKEESEMFKEVPEKPTADKPNGKLKTPTKDIEVAIGKANGSGVSNSLAVDKAAKRKNKNKNKNN